MSPPSGPRAGVMKRASARGVLLGLDLQIETAGLPYRDNHGSKNGIPYRRLNGPRAEALVGWPRARFFSIEIGMAGPAPMQRHAGRKMEEIHAPSR